MEAVSSYPAAGLWLGRPYHSFDSEMKRRFGCKVYRLALNAGMTCPNRDGTCGTGGCIFCSAGGSGDFAASSLLSIDEQIDEQEEAIRAKRPVEKFIAYYQAYTNTYAPPDYLERRFGIRCSTVDFLRQTYLAAIRRPEIAAVSIGTRPDCLPDDVLDLLGELNQIKPVWVELGLQTMHDDTARLVRRGYPLSTFECAVQGLRERGIEVVVHTILGLPGEVTATEGGLDANRIYETIRYLDGMDIQGIKLQLLHILRGTDLAKMYGEAPFPVMTMDEYIGVVIHCLGLLRPDIVIHRLTGDGPKDLLVAPEWSSQKRTVLNRLHAEMKRRGSRQGDLL